MTFTTIPAVQYPSGNTLTSTLFLGAGRRLPTALRILSTGETDSLVVNAPVPAVLLSRTSFSIPPGSSGITSAVGGIDYWLSPGESVVLDPESNWYILVLKTSVLNVQVSLTYTDTIYGGVDSDPSGNIDFNTQTLQRLDTDLNAFASANHTDLAGLYFDNTDYVAYGRSQGLSNATNTVANNTFTVVDWSLATISGGGGFGTPVGGIALPPNITVRIYGAVEFAANATGYRRAGVIQSGNQAVAPSAGANRVLAHALSGVPSGTIPYLVPLEPVEFSTGSNGDYISLEAWQNSGGSLALGYGTYLLARELIR